MISLLDRYLFAVERALPKDVDAADVTAEIRDDLQSQIDDGTPEFDAIKAYGDPRVVAVRYSRVPYLIGPQLYPFYRETLRNVLVAALALVLLVGGIAAILAHDGVLFFDALETGWNVAIWIVVIVTAIFATAERVPTSGDRVGPFSRAWDPLRLPAPGALPPVGRFGSLVEFCANFLALLALLDARTQHIPLDRLVANVLASGHAVLTPAWIPLYYAAVVGTAILAGSAITLFLRPPMSAFHEVARIVSAVVVLAGAVMTLARGPWIVASQSGWNTAALVCLLATLLVFVVTIAQSVRSLARPAPHTTART
jgi:hypothetical protein